MSLLRSRSLAIAITPAGVGGIRRATAAGEKFDEIAGSTANLQLDWNLAKDQFSAWMETNDVKKGAINVVVSDDFARYSIIPWTNVELSGDAKKAYACSVYSEMFGDMSGWDIYVDTIRYSQNTFSCSLPMGLLAGIQEIAERHNVKIKKITPFFPAIFNRFNRTRPVRDGMFVVTTQQSSVIASFKNGYWIGLRSSPTFDIHSLEDGIYREKIVLFGSSTACVHIYQLGASKLPEKFAGGDLHHLTIDSAYSDPTLRMAEIGMGP